MYLGALYTVRLGLLNLYGLCVVRLDRPLLPVSKYALSTMNAITRYRAHNQYALATTATSMIHLKRDIPHYSTVARSVDLGTRGKKSAVHFFLYGGILASGRSFLDHCRYKSKKKIPKINHYATWVRFFPFFFSVPARPSDPLLMVCTVLHAVATVLCCAVSRVLCDCAVCCATLLCSPTAVCLVLCDCAVCGVDLPLHVTRSASNPLVILVYQPSEHQTRSRCPDAGSCGKVEAERGEADPCRRGGHALTTCLRADQLGHHAGLPCDNHMCRGG